MGLPRRTKGDNGGNGAQEGEHEHEPRTASDENVLAVRQGRELSAPREHGCVPPDARVVEMATGSVVAVVGGRGALLAFGERCGSGLRGTAAFIAATGCHCVWCFFFRDGFLFFFVFAVEDTLLHVQASVYG